VRAAEVAVVAYPVLSEEDGRWIERIRVRNDPLAGRIAAHITLVFPARAAPASVVAHVRRALRGTRPLSLVLRRVASGRDVVAGGYYVSLLAGEGKVALTTLHRALYKGILTAYRRPDPPFVPHVTVGRHGHLRQSERLARRLEKESRSVRARIDGVGVVEVRDALVRTVAMVPMGKAGRRSRRT
jgi:2'-5' RNA ligase